MEHSYKNNISATRLAATIAKIADIEKPLQAEEPIEWISDIMEERLGGKAEKVLIFSADAIPAWLVRKYPEKFATVWKHTPMMIPVRTALPTITPIDYAAFFSGAQPEINGVDRYLKPIISEEITQPLLKSDSLIASAVRSGKKVCVITCSDGCIGAMLSKSGADFRIIPNDDDEAMFEEAGKVVESKEYDFVFLYQLGYDYAQHKAGPEGETALETLDKIIKRFSVLYKTARENWSGRTLVLFHTDHGCHKEEEKGNHGKDNPEDTDIFHFWGGFSNE